MSPATAHEVTARKWDHGWELHVPDVGVTQCGTLDQATRQVRDYLSTMFDLDGYDGDVTIVPEVAGIVDTIRTLRKLDADLEVMYVKKDEARDAVLRAMMDQGFSYADIAGAIGVSKGRVSQLAHS